MNETTTSIYRKPAPHLNLSLVVEELNFLYPIAYCRFLIPLQEQSISPLDPYFHVLAGERTIIYKMSELL